MAKYGQPILLDHQYAALAANSPAPNSASIVRRAIDRQPEENQSFHVKRAAWGCAGVTIIRCTALAPTLRGPTDLENTNAPARSWRFVAVGNNSQNVALISRAMPRKRGLHGLGLETPYPMAGVVLRCGRQIMDDLKKKGVADRSKINMDEDYEVKYWTKELGVSKDELQRAVDKVGNSAAAVRKELGRRRPF